MANKVTQYQKYPEYKDSGVEWLGEIPSHWDLKSSKFLFNIVNGSTPKSGIEDYWEGDITWVTPTDLSKIQHFEISESSRNITQKGLDSCGTSLVPKRSLILSCRAPIGSLAITTKEVCTNQGCKSLVVKAEVNTKFMYYFLSVSTKQLNVLGRGTTFLELSSDELGNFKLPYPISKEQFEIANFLDHETAKIDTLIAKQEKLIELLKEKRQAVISHAVTKGLNPDVAMKDSGVEWLGDVPEHWLIPNVGYHSEVTKLTGFEYTNLWQPKADGEVIALRGFNIQERYLDLKKTEKISKDLSFKLLRSKLFKGDLVLPCTGTLGNAALIDRDDTYHINQNIAKATFNKDLFLSEFCLYWFTSPIFKKMVDFNNTSGMQPVLLIGDIRKLPILLSPLNEQKEIVVFLNRNIQKIDSLIKKAESAIQLMQERRTALISAAVTGKIDVRDWQAPKQQSECATELIA